MAELMVALLLTGGLAALAAELADSFRDRQYSRVLIAFVVIQAVVMAVLLLR